MSENVEYLAQVAMEFPRRVFIVRRHYLGIFQRYILTRRDVGKHPRQGSSA